ncbi:unnamed protein product [Staurois parvus]|uniref:Uncharacterized protein n=1 Tax=Staurois parvus TaxID=386267 RepID=A0ABN9DAX5_9NEOB|nr:unnamed protein product [Staurois parvus]
MVSPPLVVRESSYRYTHSSDNCQMWHSPLFLDIFSHFLLFLWDKKLGESFLIGIQL